MVLVQYDTDIIGINAMILNDFFLYHAACLYLISISFMMIFDKIKNSFSIIASIPMISAYSMFTIATIQVISDTCAV